MKKKTKEQAAFFSHFSKKMNKGFFDYVINVALKESRYIFTYRKGNKQYGYCTHCKKDFLTDGLKHGIKATCIKCKSECTVKASGLGRKTLVDDAYIVYYQKSKKDPQAITASGIYVKRDYRGDFREVQTQYRDWAFYLFQKGNAEMYELWGDNDFYKRETIFSEYQFMQNRRCYCSIDNIRDVVKGTPFQYCTWEHYPEFGDRVKVFGLAAKYPCVEYLTKLGLGVAVRNKLWGAHTYGAINWSGQTINQVLRLPKQQINEVVDKAKSSIEIMLALRLLQLSNKDGSKLTFDECACLANKFGSMRDLTKVSKGRNLRKAAAYLKKQMSKDNSYRSDNMALVEWRDYLNMAEEMCMDLNDDYAYFPPNLKKAHDSLVKQVKVYRDAIIERKIEKRLATLFKKYEFHCNGLIIRPAKSAEELIREGEKLHHCVGGYTKAYADGKTTILLIRRADKPNRPFFTVEVKAGRVTQAYGKGDCWPTDEVNTFLNHFKKTKLPNKSKERGVAV